MATPSIKKTCPAPGQAIVTATTLRQCYSMASNTVKNWLQAPPFYFQECFLLPLRLKYEG
jgi:hypothetical protein